MRIEGRIWDDGDGSGLLMVEIPALDVSTQAESYEDGLIMAVDALGLLLEEHTDGEVCAKDLVAHETKGKEFFEIETQEIKAIVTLLLKRLRMSRDLSQAAVARLLGSSSRNSIGQYEEGKSEPGLSKIQEILGALDLDVKLSIVPRKQLAS